MNKHLLICAVLLIGVFFAANGLCATYDATGEWDYTDYNHSDNCGANLPYEEGTEIIIQNGNNFFVILGDSSFSGTVNGNVYTGTEQWCEQGGQVTANYTLTASSETQASGSANWTWSDGDDSCGGRWDISMTRKSQATPTYNATGTWDYSNTSHWSTCDSSNPPENRTATVTQDGNRITIVDDLQRISYGFVDGAKYTFARTYMQIGGMTAEIHRVTLDAGGTSGTGTGGFVWDDNCWDDCQGGFNFSIVKQQQTYTISGNVSQLEGVLMTLSGDGSETTTTDASGSYSFGNVINGNYTITPTKDGYRFEPASRNVTINDGDMTGIDFVAHQVAATGPGIPLLLLDDDQG